MSTATVTGSAGPDIDVTAVVFTGVNSFSLSSDNNILSLVQSGKVTDIDVSAATTITCTVSGGQYTLTVS